MALLNFDPSLAPRVYYSEGDFEMWEESPVAIRLVTARMRILEPGNSVPADSAEASCLQIESF